MESSKFPNVLPLSCNKWYGRIIRNHKFLDAFRLCPSSSALSPALIIRRQAGCAPSFSAHTTVSWFQAVKRNDRGLTNPISSVPVRVCDGQRTIFHGLSSPYDACQIGKNRIRRRSCLRDLSVRRWHSLAMVRS